MRTIRWTRPTESGLCDRLYDLHFMATYGSIRGANIYTKWEKFDISPLDAPHRRQDILLENVLAHVRLPTQIVIDKLTKCDSTFDKTLGAAATYEDLWWQHVRDYCTLETFKETLAQTAQGFGFCPEINQVLATLPERFCALHVRRGDKVRNEPTDGCFIETTELYDLNKLTFRSIDWALTLFDQFFVCGDEDAKNKPFVDYIRDHGGQIIEIPQLEKWRMTYYDIAVLTRSQFNITSQRRSTFSSFPALIGKGNYRTVYDLERDGVL